MANLPSWPNNARTAVLVTVMFESFSEGKAPPYSPMTTALKPGTRDLLGISWARYGGKTGIWRLMRVLDEFAVHATVCISGKAAEDFPDAAKALYEKGHELAGHSYTQDLILPYMEASEERDVIRRCARIIQSVTGAKPAGWFSPVAAPTERTAEYLAEEGFLWHGDYNDADLPYVLETSKGPLVAIAHSDFTDNRVLRGSPRDFYQVYKDGFDFLYRGEAPSVINLTVHAHFGGRPMMSAMLAEVLRYMKGFDGVWFARHDEVARLVLESR
ncbi:MAG TPA: polysaccharide deacetylase family protein [Verrucomicrobiae bacterium]|nr:polysaccharide deacetylase family protein [Verrucomicrobiae bacterium]